MIKYILVIFIAALLSGCQPIRVEKNNTDREFAYNVTSKLLGENTFSEESFRLLTCTVKNRLDRGWNAELVLNAYNGYSKQPTDTMVNFVQSVLESENCPPVYFAYNINDLANFRGASTVEPLYIVNGIYYYSYEQYRLLTQ